MPSLSPRSKTKRQQLQSRQSSETKKQRYVPNLNELSTVLNQYIDEKQSRDGYSSPSTIEIGDIQQYIMEQQPTWSVPEKRRLQKLLNRTTNKKQPPSPSVSETSTTAPSTPSSEQANNIGDSTHSNNSGLDNVSERSISRSQRLKGITNRLFGSKKNLREAVSVAPSSPSKQPPPPILEVQAKSVDVLLNGESMQQNNHDVATEQQGQSFVKNDASDPINTTITDLTSTHEDPIRVDATMNTTSVERSSDGVLLSNNDDIDESLLIYNDDNDGKVTKQDRCCICWFC